MEKRSRWRFGLIPRFIATYLLILLLPATLLCYSIYANANATAQSELLRARRDSAYSDRLYLQNQLQNVEMKYYQFKNSRSLTDVLDNTYSTDRTVMYEYIRELRSLINGNSDADYIDDILIYTSNYTAMDILPSFRDLDELYALPLTDAFIENPNRELFKRFWVVDTVNGELRLTYYAGLMNSLFRRANGVLAIVCNAELFRLFLPENQTDVSTYLFFNGKQIYAQNATEDGDSLFERLGISGGEADTDAFLDEESGRAVSVVRLAERGVTVVQTSGFPKLVALPTAFWLALGAFVALSVLLIVAVFHPIRNITRLSRHLKASQSATLIPYPAPTEFRGGISGSDEVDDLIREYNAMVERTNALSRTVHQNELLLRNAQIEMLQSQLNPHFFYGTLENIRMLAEAHGETLIAEIAYEFGNLMRYSLSREYFVTLEKEIDIVRQYVEIQRKRLGNRFRLTWTLDADASQWQCPKFILFSMVENAFTHDVTRTRRQVNIEVRVREQADELFITVSNDGPGVEPERLATIQRLIRHPEEREHFQSNSNGRSIFNISDRLRLYYGDDFGFSITSEPDQSSAPDRSPVGRQTVCSVRIRRTARMIQMEDSNADSAAY